MTNFEDFTRELEGEDEGKTSGSGLAGLRDLLRKGLSPEPSGQEQAWAWTRLQARLATPELIPGSFLWMRLAGWGAMAGLALVVGWATLGHPKDRLTVQVDPFHEEPSLYAVAFHSSEAHADVVWVGGYSDMQANDPIR